MTIEGFTPISALIGGVMIGLAATLLLFATGRIAGVSGIAGGLVRKLAPGDAAWRVLFVAGLIVGAGIWHAIQGMPPLRIDASVPMLLIGGLLVGFGTQLGSGCTSGHGVCGLARLSGRSLVATLLFMASAIITVYVVRHVAGG